jgi:prepilin-type N-terminal cleavage/methylation domain-containing protein
MPRFHSPTPVSPRTRRDGFSVVEVLVALVIVTIGLLGVAGASAMSLRAANIALRERAAVDRALTRLAILTAGGCANAASGQLQLPRGLTEQWTAAPPTHGVRMLEARVEWDDRGARRSVLLRSALPC